MILIGFGGNLDSPVYGSPRSTLSAAADALGTRGVRIVARSRWYRTAPVPASDQPWFVNQVIGVETDRSPAELLALMREVEHAFGRVRGARNAARILDVDLLDFDGQIVASPSLTLPHPRLAVRAFVLLPLRDVAPDWRHPQSGLTVEMLIARLPADHLAGIIDEGADETADGAPVGAADAVTAK